MKSSNPLRSALIGEDDWQNLQYASEGQPKEVYVEPIDLLPMLERYLNDETSEEYLQGWARWVLTREEFCIKDQKNDQVADYYEPMWAVLQQLSMPVIDGPITHNRIQQFREVLRAL